MSFAIPTRMKSARNTFTNCVTLESALPFSIFLVFSRFTHFYKFAAFTNTVYACFMHLCVSPLNIFTFSNFSKKKKKKKKKRKKEGRNTHTHTHTQICILIVKSNTVADAFMINPMIEFHPAKHNPKNKKKKK